MELIWDGITEALRLVFTGDGYVYEVTFLSLYVSGVATLIALAVGLTIASFLAFRAVPGRTLVISVFYAGMALPPVAVGLFVAVMLWRTGPLGRPTAVRPARSQVETSATAVTASEGTLAASWSWIHCALVLAL